MSSKEEKLILAKQKLNLTLGSNEAAYWKNMKTWFREKWTFEQLDNEQRKILNNENISYHNEFFSAFLNKINVISHSQGGGNNSSSGSGQDSGGGTSNNKSGKKRKRNSRAASDRATFDPVDLFDYLPDECSEIIRPPTGLGSGSSGVGGVGGSGIGGISTPPPISPQKYCVQEWFLPDTGLVNGRLLIGAWEMGLISADDNVSELVVIAVQILLKNIITGVVKNRKHYRLTGGGTYFYDIGHPLKDPTLRNTLSRQQIDDAPVEEVDKTIISAMNSSRSQLNDDIICLTSCEEILSPPKRRINILDLYHTLQDRQIIPSHSVYSINMERISNMLN